MLRRWAAAAVGRQGKKKEIARDLDLCCSGIGCVPRFSPDEITERA